MTCCRSNFIALMLVWGEGGGGVEEGNIHFNTFFSAADRIPVLCGPSS